MWLAGGGTALGTAGSLYGMFRGQSAYSDLIAAAQKQQRIAQMQQQAATEYARQRELQMQNLAGQPLNPQAFFSPMRDAQIAALRREAMASSMGGAMPPDLAERTFQTETLPKFVQGQWTQATQFAENERQRQLAALGFMPSSGIQAGNLNPGGQDLLAAMSHYPSGMGQGMGDVSAFGNYLKLQQMRQDQLKAQQDAQAQSSKFMNLFRTSAPVPPVDTSGFYNSGFGTSAYDPHRDRLGASSSKGLDTGWLDYGPSAYGNGKL